MSALPFRFPLDDYAGGGVMPPKPAVEPAKPTSQHLYGLHARTGQWTRLYEVTDLDHEKVFRTLAEQRQPDIARGFVVVKDFSAFRIDMYVTIQMLR